MTLPAWYGKALSAAMVMGGTAVTALTPYYGGRSWFDAVVAALAVLGVHGTLYTPPSTTSSSAVSPLAPTPAPTPTPQSSSAPLL